VCSYQCALYSFVVSYTMFQSKDVHVQGSPQYRHGVHHPARGQEGEQRQDHAGPDHEESASPRRSSAAIRHRWWWYDLRCRLHRQAGFKDYRHQLVQGKGLRQSHVLLRGQAVQVPEPQQCRPRRRLRHQAKVRVEWESTSALTALEKITTKSSHQSIYI